MCTMNINTGLWMLQDYRLRYEPQQQPWPRTKALGGSTGHIDQIDLLYQYSLWPWSCSQEALQTTDIWKAYSCNTGHGHQYTTRLFVGSWQNHNVPRWLQRIFISACSSLLSSLQFHLSQKYINHLPLLSLSSLHHLFHQSLLSITHLFIIVASAMEVDLAIGCLSFGLPRGCGATRICLLFNDYITSLN